MTKNNMWDLNFNEDGTLSVSPKNIVQTQCDALRELTNGRVIAKITPYKGHVSYFANERTITGHISYFTAENISSDFHHISKAGMDIQEDLGDVESSYFVYEMFLTASAMPNYKFRIMFLSYALECYPVNLILDEGVAEGINVKQFLTCPTEESFVSMLGKILSAPKVKKVINSLHGK